MEIQSLLLAAIQSSFLLGLLHGTNPCSHSWLVLAPFVASEKSGKRIFILTTSFLAGISVACLLLGLTLGSISKALPHEFVHIIEIGTSIALIIVGALLLFKPKLIHRHDVHCHDHDGCNHSHSQKHLSLRAKLYQLAEKTKMLPVSLFTLGFIIMIVPCPTTTIMYGYALNAGGPMAATMAFMAYAIATTLSVGTIIFFIFRLKDLTEKLKKDWVENLTLRLSGAIIVLFSIYNLIEVLEH